MGGINPASCIQCPYEKPFTASDQKIFDSIKLCAKDKDAIMCEAGEGIMTFNFDVVSSPDPDLTVDNVELQEYAGDLLQAIIRDGIETDSVIMKERDASQS